MESMVCVYGSDVVITADSGDRFGVGSGWPCWPNVNDQGSDVEF